MFEKVRIKFEKNEWEFSTFYLKQLQLAKFNHKNLNLYWSWKIEKFLENWIVKLYFHLPSDFVCISSRKKSRGIIFFSVNQSENNDDTSENKESAVYCC